MIDIQKFIICCPKCGFSKEVSKANFPSQVNRVTCPKCKNKFELSGSVVNNNSNPGQPPVADTKKQNIPHKKSSDIPKQESVPPKNNQEIPHGTSDKKDLFIVNNKDLQDFIGEKYIEYYAVKFKKFNKVDHRNNDFFQTISWNWAAFFFPIYWYLYRKMNLTAIILWILALIPGFYVIWMIMGGLRGNWHYYKKCNKRIISEKTKMVIETGHINEIKLRDSLVEAGGTARWVFWIILVAISIPIIGILAAIIIPQFSAYRMRSDNRSEKQQNVVVIENRYSMEIPSFLSKATDLNDDASLQYKNIFSDLYIIVLDETKKEFSNILSKNELASTFTDDFEGYSEMLMAYFLNEIATNNRPDFTDFTLNGLNAKKTSIESTFQGHEMYIVIVFVEGKDRFYEIMAWTSKTQKEKHFLEIDKMINSFKEINAITEGTSDADKGSTIEIVASTAPIKEVSAARPVSEPLAIITPPKFPGGDKVLAKWLDSHLNYPVMAQRMGIAGKVVVEFTVDENGKVSNAIIRESLHKLCDEEAIRLVKSMPLWKPGEKNGVKITQSYILPICFVLQ
jgi:TonB family protein